MEQYFISYYLGNGTVLYQSLSGISKRRTEAKALVTPSLATAQQETVCVYFLVSLHEGTHVRIRACGHDMCMFELHFD
jgi:hypothetical protein